MRDQSNASGSDCWADVVSAGTDVDAGVGVVVVGAVEATLSVGVVAGLEATVSGAVCAAAAFLAVPFPMFI